MCDYEVLSRVDSQGESEILDSSSDAEHSEDHDCFPSTTSILAMTSSTFRRCINFTALDDCLGSSSGASALLM